MVPIRQDPPKKDGWWVVRVDQGNPTTTVRYWLNTKPTNLPEGTRALYSYEGYWYEEKPVEAPILDTVEGD